MYPTNPEKSFAAGIFAGARQTDPDTGLRTGHFSLFPILEFARRNLTLPTHYAGNAEYRGLITRTVLDVTRLVGWYLWGRIDDTGAYEMISPWNWSAAATCCSGYSLWLSF